MFEFNWTQDLVLREQPERFRFELIKILLGLLILLTLVSQGPFDPDPLSLMTPAGGVENWFGVPGALFAGFWLRFFGWSSLILVAFLLFSQSTHKRFVPAFMAASIHFLGFSLLLGLIFPPEHPKIGFYSGLYGVIANQGFSGLGLRFLGVLLLTGFLIKASLNYRLKGHFLLFIVQGCLGLFSGCVSLWGLILELKRLTPTELLRSLAAERMQGADTVKDELIQPKSDDLLMRKALEALSKKNRQSTSKREDEK